jgi:hypothetical protein
LRTRWAENGLQLYERGETLPQTIELLMQVCVLSDALRIVAIEGEPVGQLGQLFSDQFASGVTWPLGYSNGVGIYIPMSYMLAEGGYEVSSFWEYGHFSQLAPGIESVIADGVSRALAALPSASLNNGQPSRGNRWHSATSYGISDNPCRQGASNAIASSPAGSDSD